MLCTRQASADRRRRGSTHGGERSCRVLTTIVDTVTICRHRSTQIVTDGLGRPCGRPLRARRLRAAGGRTPRAKGPGPGAAGAQNLPQQWCTAVRGVAGHGSGSLHRPTPPAYQSPDALPEAIATLAYAVDLLSTELAQGKHPAAVRSGMRSIAGQHAPALYLHESASLRL